MLLVFLGGRRLMSFALLTACRRSSLLPALLLSLLFHAALILGGELLEPSSLTMVRPVLRVRLGAEQTDLVRPADKSIAPGTGIAPSVPLFAKQVKGGTADAWKSAQLSAASRLPAPSPVSEEVIRPSAAIEVEDGVNGDDLRQYRMALAIDMRRYREFLVSAQTQGWSGQVGIVVHLTASSRPQALLEKSSGHASLDGLALTMSMQAVRAVAVPEGLQGKTLRLPLLLDFGSASLR